MHHTESRPPTAPTRPSLEMSPGARRLRTVQQLCQEHPAFTPGGLRWLLFHRHRNGLDKAVVKLGRRILIDEERFFRWIDAQNTSDAPPSKSRARRDRKGK